MSKEIDLLKKAEKLIFATHPHRKELFIMLDNGGLERRMKHIGEKIFDPTGRVRWLLDVRELIKLNKR